LVFSADHKSLIIVLISLDRPATSFSAAHRVPIAAGFGPNFPCHTRLRRFEFCAGPPAGRLTLSYRLSGFAPEPQRRCRLRSRNVPPRAGTLSLRPERKSGSLGTP